MGATSLLEVRDALHELVGAVLGGAGVELGWNPPTEAEELSELTAAWWLNEVDVSAEPWTMPSGLQETYTKTLAITCLPADGDVTSRDAATAVLELVDLVYEVVVANPRPLSGSDWDARISWAGFTFLDVRLERAAGFAAGVEIRIGVEATRCS
jgi:hypothetical protein